MRFDSTRFDSVMMMMMMMMIDDVADTAIFRYPAIYESSRGV
jgi:hypothetical protein